LADIPFPEMPRTHTIVRSVPEHELLLTFRDDAHAVAFSGWLDQQGWDLFLAAQASKPLD
jgi:hypothetical protein